MTDTILKSDFNAAVQAANDAVKPLLLTVEASAAGVTIPEGNTLLADLAALHAELLNQLGIADDLGATGGIHMDSGGSGKGDES